MGEKQQKGLFFLGTDTGVGKTYQSVRFVRALRAKQISVGVYKPVASGVADQRHLPESVRDHFLESDPELLCRAAGLPPNMITRVCPQVFAAPLAPPSAASLEQRTVDESMLVQGANWWKSRCQFLVVEGVGGVLSPISNSLTCLDLAAQLHFPVVLVAADRLGCVSHVLLAAEAIERRGLKLQGVVLNLLPTCQPSAVGQDMLCSGDWLSETRQSNRELIRQFLPDIPIMEFAEQLVEREPDLARLERGGSAG